MNDHHASQSQPALMMPLPQLPAAFWAFHDQYYKAYRRYAHVHLGGPRRAGELVHQVLMHLAMNWAHLMEEANPAESAWVPAQRERRQGTPAPGRQPASPPCPRQPSCSR